MPFSLDAIKDIAHLARLGLDIHSHGHSIQEDLNRIVAMVDQIQAVNTQNISPMAHPLDTSQRLRHDLVTEANQLNQVTPLAPSEEAGYFLVPKVIETE